MRPNITLQAWRENRQTVGSWLSFANTQVAELMANYEFDWLCVDTQHGLIDYTDLCNMLPAISTTSTTPLVRVPWNEPYVIMKALDAGAYGVIVPMINSAEDAKRAVSACKYPPAGGRSYGPARALLYAGSDYAEHANDEIPVILMIETAQGLANVDEIAATTGVDCLFIGPSDLALAVGLLPGRGAGQPVYEQAVDRIVAACERNSIAVGAYTHSAEIAVQYLERGFQMVDLMNDSRFLAAGASAALGKVNEARRAAGKAQPEVY